jgi:hypothetical protein
MTPKPTNNKNKIKSTKQLQDLAALAEEVLVANHLQEKNQERHKKKKLMTKLKKMPAKWKAILLGAMITSGGVGTTLYFSPEQRKSVLQMYGNVSSKARGFIEKITTTVKQVFTKPEQQQVVRLWNPFTWKWKKMIFNPINESNYRTPVIWRS